MRRFPESRAQPAQRVLARPGPWRCRLLAALLVSGCGGAHAGNDVAIRTFTQLDAVIPAAMAEWRVPGLAIAVVSRDSILFERGYGVRSVDSREPVDTHTLFALMSPTKSFTAAALAMLADEGRLSLDDPVVRYLPHFRMSDARGTRDMRVADLVSNRSGYPDAPHLWFGTELTSRDIVRRLPELPRRAEPGTEFLYNNVLFVVAGEVIEAASGLSWHDFVEQRILAPLAMRTSTTSVRDLRTRDNVAYPHARRFGGRLGAPRVIPRLDADNIGPAGMIHSNAREMAAWLRLHLNDGAVGDGRLLSAAAVHELWQPRIAIPAGADGSVGGDPAFRPLVGYVQAAGYGLGWFTLRYRGETVVFHGGGLHGYRSIVGLLPDRGIGTVILSNLDATPIAFALMFQVFDMFLDGPPTDWTAAYLRERL